MSSPRQALRVPWLVLAVAVLAAIAWTTSPRWIPAQAQRGLGPTISPSTDQMDTIAKLQTRERECEAASRLAQQAHDALYDSDFRHAYDLAVEGLSHNTRCPEVGRLPIGGALLSIKAITEHFLHLTGALTDLIESNRELESCVAQPRTDDNAADIETCAAQLRDNEVTQRRWEEGE